MIKNVLTHLGGIEAYGVLSIALFFVFFTGVLVWAGCKKKPHLDAMSVLPLDDATPAPGPALHEAASLLSRPAGTLSSARSGGEGRGEKAPFLPT